MSRKKHAGSPASPLGLPREVELDLAELAAIVERTQSQPLNPEEHAKLKVAMATLATTLEIVAVLRAELQSKQTSVARLRQMVFGAKTEKTATVLEEDRARLPGGVSQILEKSAFAQDELFQQIQTLVARHASAR